MGNVQPIEVRPGEQNYLKNFPAVVNRRELGSRAADRPTAAGGSSNLLNLRSPRDIYRVKQLRHDVHYEFERNATTG